MPKRLAVFCDGTWNDLRTTHLTNVARLAKCVKPMADDGVSQIVFYDEGVGVASDIGKWTDRLVRWLGGGFGRGLDRKVEAAYRFLVLNYEPDDEIFVFGFSRGAYTARSLCGLIRKCGILRRDCFYRIPEAVQLYRDERHPRDPELSEFRDKYAHARSAGAEDDIWVKAKAGDRKSLSSRASEAGVFHAEESYSYRMMYLGLWDTVGSLGIPKNFWFSKSLNRRYGFHDTELSSLISSARHAVALEENRNVFDVSPIANIIELNTKWVKRAGGRWNVSDAAAPEYVPYNHRPYQQVWFPGDHGAVGGGNPQHGLSSATLLWVAEGAANVGLEFDAGPQSELGEAAQKVNPVANWLIDKNGKPKTGDEASIYGIGGFAARSGPSLVEELSMTTRLRWYLSKGWQPRSLAHCPPPGWPSAWPPDPPSGFPSGGRRMPVPPCYPTPGSPSPPGNVRVRIPIIGTPKS